MDCHDTDANPPPSDKQKNTFLNKKRSKSDKIKLTKFSDRNNMKWKNQNFTEKARAAIYIGHIPHGFYEDEMRAYFSQFGKVHATMVCRSKNTGRSKGYGFVEFEDKEVAQIAAESMNNYLMYNKVLQCRYIAPEERKGCIYNRPVYSVLPKVRNRIFTTNKKKKAFIALDQNSYKKKAQNKIDEFKKYFGDRGIDFSFKVNFASSEDNKSLESKDVELKSPTSCSSESKNDADDQFGVLEIDESDDDIHFKTPPKVKKIIKRSSTCLASSDVIPNKMPRQVQQGKKLKNSSVGKIKKHKTPKENKESNHMDSKIKNTSKIKEKPLEESFKPKKAQNKKGKISKKDGVAKTTRKKITVKEKKKPENKQGK